MNELSNANGLNMDGRYRYNLKKSWDGQGETVMVFNNT